MPQATNSLWTEPTPDYINYNLFSILYCVTEACDVVELVNLTQPLDRATHHASEHPQKRGKRSRGRPAAL
jgi:hypothetical protein